MSVALRDGEVPLSPLEAYRALEDFARQSGEQRLMLLAHCAVPEQLRPDLVNLIKVNFLPYSGSDLSVDADVIFNPIFEPIGSDFYRMEPEVRRQCLAFLDAAYRWEASRRTEEVARFLLRYLDELETKTQGRGDTVFSEFIDIQRWGAWAFLDPARTARDIAQALATHIDPANGTRFRLDDVTAAISLPLAGHQELLAYARGVNAIQNGDTRLARDLAESFSEQGIEIEDVKLPSLRELLGVRVDVGSPVAETRAARSYTGFEYDVFVVSSHGDPRGIDRAPLAGWTHRLIDELRQDIESTSTEFDQLALWDDRETDPTLYLTPTIKDCVSNSALLLIVMSPRFLASSWCKDEREWFGQEVQDRLRTGRVIIVRALPTNESMWPDFLRDDSGLGLLGFWFHPRPAKEGVRPFGWPDPRPSDHEFFDALSRLSTILMQRLRMLHKQKSSIAAATATVLLAQVTDDLEEQRDEIRRYLDQWGVGVLPEGDYYPQTGDDFLRAVQYDLRKADLFVQLLGPNPSRRPPDLPQGYARCQYDAAKSEAGRRPDFTILLWRRPDTDLPLRDGLEERPLFESPEMLLMGLESFKREIINAIERQQSGAAPAGPDWPEVAPSLDWSVADHSEARRAFAQLITRAAPFRILPIHGSSETGKSHLSKQFLGNSFKIQGLTRGRFDFKGSSDMDTELRDFAERLKVKVPAAGTGVSAQLANIFASLEATARPTLLIFDTFELAGEAERWVKENLLLSVISAPWLRVIIVGQRVPARPGEPWAGISSPPIELRPPTVEEWFEYGQAHRPGLSLEFVRQAHELSRGKSSVLSQLLGPAAGRAM